MKKLDNMSMVEYYLCLTNDAEQVQYYEETREKNIIEFMSDDPEIILNFNMSLLSAIQQDNPEFLKKVAIKIVYLNKYILRVTNMEK